MGTNLYIMKYIVYCTRNKTNSKIYIGVHKTDNPFKFDGYLGCGLYDHNKNFKARTAFQKALKKHKAHNFTRITLGIFDDEDSAYALESALVDINFIKRRDTYNLVVGGKFNGSDASKRPVVQYSLQGNLIEIHESMTNAATKVKSTPQDISASIAGRYKTVKGFIWKCFKDGVVPDRIEPSITTRGKAGRSSEGITQYSKAGYKMKSWDSMRKAANHFNCSARIISAICKGESERAHIAGFQWRYTSDGIESLPRVKS